MNLQFCLVLYTSVFNYYLNIIERIKNYLNIIERSRNKMNFKFAWNLYFNSYKIRKTDDCSRCPRCFYGIPIYIYNVPCKAEIEIVIFLLWESSFNLIFAE